MHFVSRRLLGTSLSVFVPVAVLVSRQALLWVCAICTVFFTLRTLQVAYAGNAPPHAEKAVLLLWWVIAGLSARPAVSVLEYSSMLLAPIFEGAEGFLAVVWVARLFSAARIELGDAAVRSDSPALAHTLALALSGGTWFCSLALGIPLLVSPWGAGAVDVARFCVLIAPLVLGRLYFCSAKRAALTSLPESAVLAAECGAVVLYLIWAARITLGPELISSEKNVWLLEESLSLRTVRALVLYIGLGWLAVNKRGLSPVRRNLLYTVLCLLVAYVAFGAIGGTDVRAKFLRAAILLGQVRRAATVVRARALLFPCAPAP